MAEGIKVGDTASRGRILDLVYPVGTVYKSFNPKSPAEWLGGTWEKIEGRVLLGAGEEYPVGRSIRWGVWVVRLRIKSRLERCQSTITHNRQLQMMATIILLLII